jgi:diguanylate cyclase
MPHPPVTDVPDPLGLQAKQALAGLVARMAVFAGMVDVIYFLYFLSIGSTALAWVNVFGILLYISIFVLVRRRKLGLAITLFWLEVLPHAVLGTLLLGWGSGFHYIALVFVPMVMMTNSRLAGVGKSIFLVLVLASLEVILWRQGPLAPITEHQLLMVRWFNLLLFVFLMATLTTYYWGKIVSAEKRLRKLAVVDALTGLHNRHHFQQVWEMEMARLRRSGGQACVLMADLDHFKVINDTRGHVVGDQVLTEVSQVLKQGVRDVDALARWGGEEFLLLMPDTPLDVALLVAERLRTSIDCHRLDGEAGDVRITASFGLTQLRAADTLSLAIARADQAMYRSKTQGRNRVSHE